MKIKKVYLDDLDKIMKMEKRTFSNDSFSKKFMKMLIIKSTLFLKLVKSQDQQEIIGFIIAIKDNINTINILNFLIKKKYRNKGYGSYLLKKTLEIIKALSEIKKIVLNVKTNNDIAIKIYQKFNFRIIQVIENYYRNQENAYLMELII